MGEVIHIDKQGGGGSGIGWSGQVEFRANLPITIGDPVVGTIYLVEKPTTLLGFTTYQSGLYIRDTNAGALSDWRRLNVKVQFTDSEFSVVQAADNSAKAKFDLSLVSTSTTRTLTIPNKSGTIALLSDVEASDTLAEVMANGNATGANDIIMTTPQEIKPSSGNAFIRLWNGGDDKILIGTAPDPLLIPFSHISLQNNGYIIQSGNFNQGTHYINRNNVVGTNIAECQTSIFKNPFSIWGRYGVKANDVADQNTFNFPSYPFDASAQNVTIKQSILNVIAGGKDFIVKTSNAIYSNRFILSKNNEAFELKLEHTSPTGTDKLQTFQDDDGEIALTKNILKQKSGQVLGGVFAGNPKKATVTFATAFADANYSVSIIGQGGDNRTWTIESKLAGSFVINANANPVLGNPVLWIATKHGEN